jgi:hypothetical protein
MRGQVLQADAGGGLLLGEDGNRYRFATGEWKVSAAPSPGVAVDFLIDGGSAREVFPINAAGGGAAPAALPERGNSELLGALGVACLLVNFVFPVVPLIAAVILGLVGASSARAFGNRPGLILSRIAWIGAIVLLAILALLIAMGLSLALPMLHDLLGNFRTFVHGHGTVI